MPVLVFILCVWFTYTGTHTHTHTVTPSNEKWHLTRSISSEMGLEEPRIIYSTGINECWQILRWNQSENGFCILKVCVSSKMKLSLKAGEIELKLDQSVRIDLRILLSILICYGWYYSKAQKTDKCFIVSQNPFGFYCVGLEKFVCKDRPSNLFDAQIQRPKTDDNGVLSTNLNHIFVSIHL